MSNLASMLAGVNGERVALKDVNVSAVLRDLMAEVNIAQTYRNDESVSIEAVYTFPLPLDAVLLELEVETGGRRLQGVVVEKTDAEARYEDAISSGDAAVMLEAIEPGLYTLNVGNLLPGEEAIIRFDYAIVYTWTGDRLRFFLPTTIAPRYGESPRLPHQAIETSLTVENRFSLQVSVFGSLRNARFVCPSHDVSYTNAEDHAVISLQQTKSVMDRDFVLVVSAPRADRSFCLCGADGDDMAAIASFQPFFPGLHRPRRLDLVVVVDCSGSMQGDSMQQARQALEGILDALQPGDRIGMIAFGSTARALSERMLACTETNLGKARRFAAALNADMGGTEVGPALRAAYALSKNTGGADILVVTDGEVAAWENIVQDAKASGHRVFPVGVGSAVSEAFLRGLAAATNGKCELVSPCEGMAERIVQHFERMRAPRAKRVEVHWPESALDVSPRELGSVFEGDTVVASARFATRPVDGKVVIEIEAEGNVMRQELPLCLPDSAASGEISTVARLAAAARLNELDEEAAMATALRHRLASRWTNWLVVAQQQGAEPGEIPVLRQVPQTLAAGWGGTGSINKLACRFSTALPMVLYCRGANYEASLSEPLALFSTSRDGSLHEKLAPMHRRLLAAIESQDFKLDPTSALEILEDSGLLAGFETLFRDADRLGLERRVVAALILAALLDGALAGHLSEALRAVEALRGYARHTTQAIANLARQEAESVKLAQDLIEQGILRSVPAGDLRAHAAGLLALLDRLLAQSVQRAVVENRT